MGVFGGTPPPSCPSTRHCAEWARTYLKYCLCSQKDSAALALGLLSVISWGVAEVPQIITNYRQKSTEGLSIAFLMTWIVGDLFNLVGCFLEPATLPTQFYMALLYTVTTLILTAQTIYYSHIYHRLKANKSRATSKPQKHQRGDTSLREKLLGAKDGGASRNNHQSDDTVPIPSSPIPVNTKMVEQYHAPSSPISDYYYTSVYVLVDFTGQLDLYQGVQCQLLVPWMGLLMGTCLLHFLVGNTHREVPNGTVIPIGRRHLLFMIILQFLYFHYRKQSEPSDEQDNADKA
nr:unnamed protein product [Digitaria exilis]